MKSRNHAVHIRRTSGDPALREILLDARDISQTLCILDHLLHPLLLRVGQLRAHTVSPARLVLSTRCPRRTRAGPNVKRPRFDPSDLRRQFRRLFHCPKEFFRLLPLGVSHALEVEEP